MSTSFAFRGLRAPRQGLHEVKRPCRGAQRGPAIEVPTTLFFLSDLSHSY